MDALGIADFALCGHDRGGRVAHRLALDHPARVTKLCVIDIAPTLDMYARTDFDFARAYYHWFHLIQPAPLPELMIGGNAAAYLHAKLGGWGSGGLGHIEPRALAEYERCFCRAEAIHTACEDYRASAGIDLDTRPREPRARPQDRLRHPGAVGRARRGAAPVRAAGALAGPVRRRSDRLGHAGRAFHPRAAARRDRHGIAGVHGLTGGTKRRFDIRLD
jgi:pimeloyl-ACP methyl ester carboxylesterase